MNKTAKEENHNFQKILKFIIPSLLGVFLFMIPIPWNGSLTIPIAIFSKLIISLLGDYLPIISVVIISLSAALAIIAKIFKPKFITNNNYLNGLFNVSPLWFSLRIIGAILATLLFTNLFLNAWDNTMTDEEIVYYLEQYPTEEKLIKLAERRNLIEKVK